MPDIFLNNERLQVKILQPGSRYKGNRFDWCGIVADVLLDQTYSFLGEEPVIDGESTAGTGLINCFELVNGAEYITTAGNKSFPRMGVGLLKKKDRSPFSSYSHYEIHPAPMQYTASETEVTFITSPIPCNGYAFEIRKKLYIINNTLFTHYCVCNTGEKALVFEEFNHNFFQFNEFSVGPDYIFSTPYAISLQTWRGEFRTERFGVRIHQPETVFYAGVEGFPGGLRPHRFTLFHEPSGMGCCEELDAPVSKVVLWGNEGVFCPEVTASLGVMPGHQVEWTRKLTFFKKSH